MITNRLTRLGVRRSRRTASVVAVVIVLALSVRPAPGQIANIAGGVATSTTNQVLGEMVSGLALAPFLLFAQIAEVFNEMFTSALNLPQAQLGQLKEIRGEITAKIQALQSLPAQERRQKLLKLIPELEREYVARIEKVLDAEQRAQFRQLLFQLRGSLSLIEPEVAEQLKLTAEQQQKLTATKDKYKDEIEDLVDDGGDVGPIKMTAMLALRKRRDKALLEVLTAEQAEQWAELKGKQQIDVEAVVKKIAAAHLSNLLAKSRAERDSGKPKNSESKGPPPSDAPPPPAPPAPKKK